MSARSFLSSLAVATALTSVIHVHEAWAQKGVFLSPQTDWAVTRAYGQGQNAGGYCALARRYEQNTILTLAQNSSEEMSLALDFQRPKFDASSNVRVVLDPGAGQQREYSIRPVSEKALVVRLGRDAAFFQALRKTGYLRAEIGNQIFSFNMADIDIGNSELVSCVAAMTQQTPVAEVEVGTPPTFNVAESQLRTEIETLKDQIARLQADNRNISATLKKGVAQAPASAAPATPDPESELKIKALTEENASLQAMLEEAKKGSPSDDQLAAKIAELEVVRAENESLKKATATDPAMSEKLAELEKIRTENESLKKTLAEKETATTSEDLQAQIETLRSANETLKRDLSDAQKAQQSSAQSAADAQKSQKELEDLRKQLSVVQLENEALKLSLQTREGAEQKASAQTEAMAKLQAENQTLKAEIETLKAKIPPEDLKEKINAIEGERKALSDGMRNAELRLETLQSSLSAKNAEMETLLAERATLQASLNLAESADRQKFTALEVELDALKVENGRLSLALADSEGQYQQALLAASKEALAGQEILKSELMEKERKLAEAAAARQELESSLSRTAAESSEALLAASRKANILQGALEEKERALAAASAARESLDLALKAKTEKVGQDVAALEAEVASLSAENGRLKADMERKSTDLASALEGAMKGQSEAETRAKSQERTLAALEADREALRRQVEAVRTEKTNDESAVLEKAEALRAENADLKQKMASLEENLQEATAQKQLVATRLDERERQARAQEIALKEQTARAVEAQRMAALREQEQKQQEQKESQSQKLAAAATPVRRAEPAPVAPPPSKAAAAPARSAGTQISALEDALRDVMGAGRKPAPAESDEAQELAQAEMLNDMTPASGDEDTPEPDQVSEAPAPMMKRLPERAPVQVPEIYSGPSEAQKLEGRLLEETKVSRPAPPVVQAPAPVRPSPVVAETIPAAPPPPISAAPPPAPAPAASSSLYAPRLSVENFLQKAGISPQGGVHLVNKASGADHLVHQWKTDAVFGSAEQMPMTDGASFEQRVQDYLKKAKKGCAGDFASSPDRSLRQGEIQAQTYELACVGSASSSASILFLGGQGAFTVLAHEAPLEQMEKVMDIRDRLLSSFGNAAES